MKTIEKPQINGFFTSDAKMFVNCAVGKSNPNRLGVVLNIKGKIATVKFSDFREKIEMNAENGFANAPAIAKKQPKSIISKFNFQRNGVAGTGFYSLLLSKANGAKGVFLATFETTEDDRTIKKPSCRVINLENPVECWDGRDISFDIEKELKALMEKYHLFNFCDLMYQLRKLDLSSKGFKYIQE